MDRFWRTAALLCLGGLGGCAGRTLEGRWEGPVPGLGDSCRVRIEAGSQIWAVCGAGMSPSAIGAYKLEGERLTVEWRSVMENGRETEGPKPTLDVTLSGPGNTVTLTPNEGGEPFIWRRK